MPTCRQRRRSETGKEAPWRLAGWTLVESSVIWRADDGRLFHCFYDVNANSNLRVPIARFFGFDPFERVVDFLVKQIGVGGLLGN